MTAENLLDLLKQYQEIDQEIDQEIYQKTEEFLREQGFKDQSENSELSTELGQIYTLSDPNSLRYIGRSFAFLLTPKVEDYRLVISPYAGLLMMESTTHYGEEALETLAKKMISRNAIAKE